MKRNPQSQNCGLRDHSFATVVAEQQALALIAARAARDCLISHLMHAFYAAQSAFTLPEVNCLVELEPQFTLPDQCFP